MSVVLKHLKMPTGEKIFSIFVILPSICLKQMDLYDRRHLVNILNNSQISSREDDVIFTEKQKIKNEL